MSRSPERRQNGLNEVEAVVNRTLQNENELLRCQLKDLIAREKTQRLEFQRLRQHRETEVASLVQAGTSHLKAEVEHLKSMLQSTSSQLLQALSEREQAKSQKEQFVHALEEANQLAAAQEIKLKQCLHAIEDSLSTSANTAGALADTVDTFQRHVLPTFKPAGFEMQKSPLKETPKVAEGKALMEQLTRLENGITLLRVIVDAKNDTLVLIRGKLKQENDELRLELQAAREAHQAELYQPRNEKPKVTKDNSCLEKNKVQQELQSLQSLFIEEVKQLKAKLKMYESEEQHGQARLREVQKELADLQDKLSSVEASRGLLEVSLKEETSARSQLVSQLFMTQKENEKIKAELETLKLSQKFLVRQPNGGRIPVEKMDLMNTVNQLLVEMNKLKDDKVALEEELKTQKRTQVRDRMKRTATNRDVEMAASNKVGDTELVSKLARARLQQLGLQETLSGSKASVTAGEYFSPTANSGPLNIDFMINEQLQSTIQASLCKEVPLREEILNCAAVYANRLPTKTHF